MSLSEKGAEGGLARGIVHRATQLLRSPVFARSNRCKPVEAVADRYGSQEARISIPEFDTLTLDQQIKLSEQGLFIIGSARSGTTILQSALNESGDVFLFGEPDFHTDPGTDDFGQRYNAMHRLYLNQETKSSFCPRFFRDDASWANYFLHLTRLYKYVGAKIVLAPKAEPHIERLFDFHSRYFYRSRYIFTFRKPLDVVVSLKSLSEYTATTRAEFKDREMSEYRTALIIYVRILRLFIRMKRNFPFVYAAFHEDMPGRFFEDLQDEVGVDLTRAARYYSDAKVRRYDISRIPDEFHGVIADITDMYEVLRREAQSGFELAQIEQNDNNIIEARWAPLGHTMRKSDLVLEALRGVR